MLRYDRYAASLFNGPFRLRWITGLSLICACLLPGTVLAQPAATAAVPRPAVFTWAAPVERSPQAVTPSVPGEAAALASAMRSAMGPVLASDDPRATHTALVSAHTMLARQGVALDKAQILLVVDRAVRVQRLWAVAAYPNGVWTVVGEVRVSTGKPGRKEHFRTPVGVFANDTAVLGYRAQGTYNENHILGNGTRGMRVWDFGWQTTDDWRTPGAVMGLRLEMHATDPTVLEPRLGRADSEGCIRIPSKFNSFLDQRGLIDARLWDAAKTERRFAALLPKDGTPSPLAGEFVVVVDTSEPDAAPSDPVLARAIEEPPAQVAGAMSAGAMSVGAGD